MMVRVLITLGLLPYLLASAGNCDALPGVWTGFTGAVPLYDEYALQYQVGAPPGSFTAVVIRPTGPIGWTIGEAQLAADNRSCVITFETGVSLHGAVNAACTKIEWDNGSSWAQTSGVEVVHLLFMNHIDVGYHIGHPPPQDPPAFARIIEVIQVYFDTYFPRAIALARALRDLGGSERMIYTSHSWLLSLFLHCPANLTLSGETLRCPSPAAVAELRAAIQAGDVYFHAGAFNIEYEQALTSDVIDFSFSLARNLADELGVPRPSVLSLRDVPGTTRALLPTLARNNITALSVGVNPWAPNAQMNANPGVWRDPATNASVLYMQTGPGICYPWPPGPDPLHPGGLDVPSCVVLPGLRHAMCWSFRVDNDGPPMSVEEVLNAFTISRWVFPGAQVWASTFENFTQHLALVAGTLNVTTGEAGDNWMQSTTADPYKIAYYREAARAYRDCRAEGGCDSADARMFEFLRLLIKTPEHTFGTPGMDDATHWSNADFARVVAQGERAYTDALSTYTEQRDIVAREGVRLLGDHPFAAALSARVAALAPARPNVTALVPVPKASWGAPVTLAGGGPPVVLALDAATGALGALALGGRQWADATSPLGALEYRTFDDADLATQGGACCWGAAGRQAAANPNSTVSATQLVGLWADSAGAPTALTALLTLPAWAHESYGAPAEVWAQYAVTPDGALNFTLQVFNKTATRLAEAAFLRFATAPLPATHAWAMKKLESWLDPLDAVAGGSPHQHGVSDGVAYRARAAPAADFFAVDTLDAAVVSPITADASMTNFVVPNDALVGPVGGFGVLLWQNAFNTNTPLFTWDTAFKWRFTLRSSGGGGGAPASATPPRAACASAADCNFNGVCSGGACACAAPWAGAGCDALTFVPPAPGGPPLGYVARIGGQNVSSWGGSVVFDDAGVAHMYAAEMTSFCGINVWLSNSQVIHATSPDPLRVPFSRVSVVQGAFSHEPIAARAPTGEFVLFFTAVLPPSPLPVRGGAPCAGCANGVSAPRCGTDANRNASVMLPTYMVFASDPDGPWSEPQMVPGTDVFSDSNFAPVINEDGSLVALTRHQVWAAPHWKDLATYRAVGAWGDVGEDPFIYRAADGVYHGIIHKGRANTTGVHYFSTDGVKWTETPTGGAAYTAEGLACRERPHMVIRDGALLALTNGAAALSCHGGSDRSFTLLRALTGGAPASALTGGAPASAPVPAAVRVADRSLARASDTFRWVGVNMDFWPSSKSKWESAGALDVDLSNATLRLLAGGLSGALLRLGGSPADFLLYDVFPGACSDANLNKTQPSGGRYFCPIWDQAQGACLTLPRWQALLEFAQGAGLSLVLDLNACWGRASPTGDMDWAMIDGLLNITASARGAWGAALWGVEFGNEVYSNIAPETYGAAVVRLRARLDALWVPPGPAPPRVMGPDAWENDLSPGYYAALLNASGGGLHAVTFHDYGDSCSGPANGNVLNVTCLDALFAAPGWVRDIAAAAGAATWNGEGALHASSGVSGLTNTFLSSLYYLHALGSYAAGGFGLFSRQTLVGGDYELVNRSTFLPTPDYFALLLFRRLVGSTALAVNASGGVKAHAFCALRGAGGVVVLLLNFRAAEGAAVRVAWPSPPPAGAVGALYALSGVAGWGGGDESSDLFRVALNNQTLALSAGELPRMEPLPAPLDEPLWMSPATAAFIVWEGAGAKECA